MNSNTAASLLKAPPVVAGEGQSPRQLALAAEKLLSPPWQKKNGAFYTPAPIVDRMVELMLAKIPDISGAAPLNILDPACGSGIFLIAVLERLLANAQSPAFNLYGVDVSGEALCLARRYLELSISQLQPSQTSSVNRMINLGVGNALLSPDMLSRQPNPLAFSPFDWKRQFPEVFNAGGFDFVIGNPPYGLARGEQLSKAENLILKQAYAKYRCGKVNKYMLFMARAYELLRPGGTLVFVVPNSWLGVQAGRSLRKLWLEDGSIEQIEVLDKAAFNGLHVETVIVVLEKAARRKHFRIVSSKGYSRDVPLAVCLTNPEHEIRLVWDGETQGVSDSIRSSSILLGSPESPFSAYIALQAYAVGKGCPPQTAADVKNHVFDRLNAEDENTLPYLQGRDVSRYQVKWSGGYLRYGAFLAEPQVKSRFEGPRVVVREILGSKPYLLQASFLESTFLYNKSVLNIVPKSGCTRELLLALTAILNSRLGSFWILQHGKKSQRSLFPKLVNQDLKNFPLPKDLSSHAGALARAAETRDDKLIDSACYDAYGLSPNHRAVIDEVTKLSS